MTAALAGAAVLLAGCGGGSGSSSQADAGFLSAVHVAAPDVSQYRTDTELVRLGHAACDEFRGHASFLQIADRLALEEGSNRLPSQDLGDVITAAVDAFCPQFRAEVS
jgi:hypothetical protein